MIRFEIQVRDRFVYVDATCEVEALAICRRDHMTASERYWTTPIFTGRNR